MEYGYGYESAISGAVLMVYWVIMLSLSILAIIGMWKMFVKAGKPGWASLIPFYGSYKLYEIAWGNGWLFLLQLVPCVNIVVMVIVNMKLAKAFGKGTGFMIGLLLLPSLFYMILGFGSAEYEGPQV